VSVDAARSGAVELRARHRLHREPPPAIGLPLVSLLCGAALVAGWKVRDEQYLIPDSGLGYDLGIVGLALIVLLLGYPLRKRMRVLRSRGRLRTWFELHMMLGVLGPAAILFHANFRLGSLNSNVALASMLLVAGSGFVGRFIYTRVHRELVSRREALETLRREAQSTRGALSGIVRRHPRVLAELRAFETFALPAKLGPARTSWGLLVLGRHTRATERACRRAIGRAGTAQAARAIRAHVRAVCRVAEFSAYDRLFFFWHSVHVPLCAVLFATSAVHVVAVHLY
jgi:hypothetical protein